MKILQAALGSIVNTEVKLHNKSYFKYGKYATSIFQSVLALNMVPIAPPSVIIARTKDVTNLAPVNVAASHQKRVQQVKKSQDINFFLNLKNR